MMQTMSSWGPLIYAGCFAATISTALTNLLSVPRLIQALGIDRIYPGLIFFSKGYGKAGEPYRGYLLVFIISALFVLIGMQRCRKGGKILFRSFFSRPEHGRSFDFQLLPRLVRPDQLLHVPRRAD